jgi:hypothetical protein
MRLSSIRIFVEDMATATPVYEDWAPRLVTAELVVLELPPTQRRAQKG